MDQSPWISTAVHSVCFSAAGDEYFYTQSGPSSNASSSIAGSKAAGAEISAWMDELHKPTGLVQFTLQLAEHSNMNLGANRPEQVNADIQLPMEQSGGAADRPYRCRTYQ